MNMKMKSVKVMAFWKGTMMFQDVMSESKYNSLCKKLNKKFVDSKLIDDCIKSLDKIEADCVRQESLLGHYNINPDIQLTNLLVINDLVNRYKAIPDNDMFGLLIMKSF